MLLIKRDGINILCFTAVTALSLPALRWYTRHCDFMSISQSIEDSGGYTEDFYSVTENKYYTEGEVGCLFRNKSERDFSIITFNIESLPKHFDEFEHTLDKMKTNIDIIGVTETKITDKVNSYYHPNLKGYKFYHSRSSTTHGSAGVFIHKSLNVNKRNDLDISIPGMFETVWLDIESSGEAKKCVIGIIYRHPGITEIPFFQRKLEKTLSSLNRSDTKYYLVGDFNVAVQDIDVQPNIEAFINMMFSNFCVNMINKPTRFPRGDQIARPSILDHFYTNHTESIREIGIMYNSITDHRPVFAIIGEKLNRKNKKDDIYVRDYKNFNREAFNRSLSNFTYNSYDNLDTKVAKLQSFIVKCIDTHIPLKKLSLKEKRFYSKPWISSGIKTSINRRNRLCKLSRINCPNQRERRRSFNKYKKKLEKIMFVAKSKFYRKKIEKCKANCKALWKVINEITSRKKKVQTFMKKLKLPDGRIIIDPTMIVNELNSFFVNVGPNLASKISESSKSFNSYLRNGPSESFVLFPTDVMETFKTINSFSFSNTEDPNKITPKIFKLGAEGLAPILSPLVNECFAKGYFPNSLKTAKVITIFKEGETDDPGNYRPISITSTISKLIEKLVKKRLLKFLHKHDILSIYQYGYRTNHSTSHAMLNVSENILDNIDKGKNTISIFLDLSKGFDCVNHKILLEKLKFYGIRGLALDFFKSYLTDRQQYTVVNGTMSCLQTILCGVPQGSVLGPLLFLIYTNDICHATNFLICLFADDTCLQISHSNLQRLATICNTELVKIDDWFRANLLTTNEKKASKYILTKSNSLVWRGDQQLINIKMGNTTLEQVDEMKYLGVYIDSALTWNSHINYLSKILSRSAGIFSKLRYYVDRATILKTYHSLFNSHLQYGILCWGATSAENINRIQVLQNKAIRNITKAPMFSRLDNHYLNLRLLKVQDLFKLEVIKFMHNHHNSISPDYFVNFFQKVNRSHAHSTRASNSEKYVIKACRTSKGQRSIKYSGPKFWNDLPNYLINLSKNKLKNDYKSYVFASY